MSDDESIQVPESGPDSQHSSERDSEIIDSANNDIYTDLHDIAVYGFVQDLQDWIAAHTYRELQKALMTRCPIMFNTPLMCAIDHVVDGSESEQGSSDDSDSSVSEYVELSYLNREQKANRKERTSLITLMLELGADPNGYRKNHLFSVHHEPLYNPLSIAASRGYVEIIPLLVSYGALLENSGGLGETAFHLATQQLAIPTMTLLLELKSDINATLSETIYGDNHGYTALHLASMGGNIANLDVVEFLLHNKADVHLKGRDGKTALEVARPRCIGAIRWATRKEFLLFASSYYLLGSGSDHILKFLTDGNQIREISQYL